MRSLLAFPLLVLAACDPTSEDAFTAGRSEDPCVQTLPACPGLSASCTLEPSRYTRQRFPGEFRFFARAEAGHEIEVILFFVEQETTGVSTEIFWNEPGCSDVYVFDSDGRDLAEEAGDSRVFREKRAVREGGEHLIEIFSDMAAELLITVDVIIPGT